MKIQILSGNDFLDKHDRIKKQFKNINYDNFHYFKYSDIYDSIFNLSPIFDMQIFFIIITEGNDVLGVLKYGNYDNDHIGINYIDVNAKYKHQGIGTKLLQYFNNLEFNLDVHCSYFSDECLKTGFYKRVFEILKNHDVCYDHKLFTLKNKSNYYDIDKTTIIKNPWLN